MLFAAISAAPAIVSAQSSPTLTMSKDEITAFAKVQVAISQAHDSADAQLAAARNKKDVVQTQLQEKLRTQIADILHHNGMTEDEYKRKTFIVSTDQTVRKTFDVAVAQLTGVPTPGQVPLTPGSRAPGTNLPAGAVGTHIGHVVNGFMDTPGGGALINVAMADARVAAQHATLAARNTASLDYMKLHAGHVLNALDPTLVPMGPGSGYGMKKAATGVAAHIDLAAKAPGASANVNHARESHRHVLQERGAAGRSDHCSRAAGSGGDRPAAAASLINQIIPLAQQLMAGVDTNGDGRITWEEGGLQQADDHIGLMLSAEPKPPM
jgi:hypothetical protein